ncbi:MAG: hypothetical protein AB8G15_18455 [Saprospiraceae bacterium]
MQVNWIMTSGISAIIGEILNYFLTKNLGSCASLYNPYFTIRTKIEEFDFEAGLKELDITTTA